MGCEVRTPKPHSPAIIIAPGPLFQRDTVQNTLRGVVGLGVTLFVLASGMAVVNGVARGFAAKRLVNNPDDAWARGVLMLY